MDLAFGLTKPVLPLKQDVVIDLLLTFRSDYAAARRAGRRPLAVSLVIDRSGSMSGEPLDQATRAAGLLVSQLRDDDLVAVVVYDDKISTLVEMQKVADREAIAKELRAVRPGGTTNLHGGWAEGCDHAEGIEGDFVRRTLLLTDGQANVGIVDPKRLVALAKERAGRGVATTTLGFGRDFNEDLLIGMAEAGQGNYYFIETPADAAQVFLIEGESITSIAAQETRVTLRPRAGVVIREVLDARAAPPQADGSVSVFVGDVYGGEDRHVAVTLAISAKVLAAAGTASLLEVELSYDPVAEKATRDLTSRHLTVTAPVGALVEPPDPNLMRSVSRIRVALAKERAVEESDAGEGKTAAAILRREVESQRERGMDEEYEIAEEISQLEYFAGTVEAGPLDTVTRKTMRDQSYQGRTRSRQDLSARGSAGGSAARLPVAKSADGGVVLACVREAGKLQVKVLSEGFDAGLKVLLPRVVREEGVRYLVEGLEPSAHHTFYRVRGKIARLAPGAVVAAGQDTGLALDELFAGGGEPWLPLLKPLIEAQPKAADFIGPARDNSVVPVRELTFQALKPNPPHRWKVVVFGQNPYPRVESATGIAMFDNTFHDWKDSQFGKVTSIRCIIKAAAMNKHKIAKATPIASIRALLAEKNAVQPPEWFQAMLAQGVLLLNAALTASSEGGRADTDAIARHTAFWRPVVERIIEEILKAKQGAPAEHKGVVFAWWGTQAKALRSTVERMQKKYPGVPVKHIDHPNPAAQGDIFCDNDHFGAVNKALASLGMQPIDWLPSVGWNKAGDADKMGEFIQKTMDLHKLYLERLQEVKDEGKVPLSPVTGVRGQPAMTFSDAVAGVAESVKGLPYFVQQAKAFAARKLAVAPGGKLDEHEMAALWLYTCESGFYRTLNAALRDPDRTKLTPFLPYLRLLLSALDKAVPFTEPLWRGVALDLRAQYPAGSTVTWWGVSSCTGKLSVAHSFLGTKGKRTLFEVTPRRAVAIRDFSAFSGEEEYVLAPGTQLKVSAVKAEKSGLCTVHLEEIGGDRAVG